MLEQRCWYIVGAGGKVVSVATSPVNCVDMNERGFTVVESRFYEPDLNIILKIENGFPVLKPVVTIKATKVSVNVANLSANSDTYTGPVEIEVYGMAITLRMGESVEMEYVEGYPLGLTCLAENVHIRYEMEGF
jgi:hypothetical protein